jgi:hypothetical protein
MKITVYPVTGEAAEFWSNSKGTFIYSSAHSPDRCNALFRLLWGTYKVA